MSDRGEGKKGALPPARARLPQSIWRKSEDRLF